MHERGACVFVWLCVFVETLLRSSHTHKGTHGALCECVHERGACVFVGICVFIECYCDMHIYACMCDKDGVES